MRLMRNGIRCLRLVRLYTSISFEVRPAVRSRRVLDDQNHVSGAFATEPQFAGDNTRAITVPRARDAIALNTPGSLASFGRPGSRTLFRVPSSQAPDYSGVRTRGLVRRVSNGNANSGKDISPCRQRRRGLLSICRPTRIHMVTLLTANYLFVLCLIVFCRICFG